MSKLWDKGLKLDKDIEKYTVGNDNELDMNLVKYDCIASKAHAKMLHKIGILSKEEKSKIVVALNEIKSLSESGDFKIYESDEDCHTAIENYLVSKLGEIGKKIHTCRSRNDQVITAMRLYEKDSLSKIKNGIDKLKKHLQNLNSESKSILIPGYTHMQKAMPNSAEKWLGSFIAGMDDLLFMTQSAYELIDKNPLGSAAGFGVPVFQVDKDMTAREMGFSDVIYNDNYVQMTRGMYESVILNVCSQIMYIMNKLSNDLMLFLMSEFGFIEMDDEISTGSSIMPNKKNPDVLEIMRANYHVAIAEEFKVKSLMGNLISGYNRDIQLIKEPLFKMIDISLLTIDIGCKVVSSISFNKEKCMESITDDLYATEKAYILVKEGMSFRDAYRKVGEEIMKKRAD